MRHQERDGNLANGQTGRISPMYSHGLATIALCKANGLSGDHTVRQCCLQSAVDYIIRAENKQDNGFRDITPATPATPRWSVWQIMALKMPRWPA